MSFDLFSQTERTFFCAVQRNLRYCLGVNSRARLIGLGTALPRLQVSQEEALAFLLKNFSLREGMRVLCQRVFAHESVRTRRFSLSHLSDILEMDLDRKNERFQREAVQLSAQSLKKALHSAGVKPRAIDFLAVVTCTGYLCPGLAPQVSERAGLRQDISYVDLVGMGCGGAVPALQAADLFARAHPGSSVAVVCTEICSAAFLMKDAADLAVSNALFGDGSASAILGPGNKQGPFFMDWSSWVVPEWRETLRFISDGGHLRNVLSPRVPEQAGQATQKVFRTLLDRNHLKATDIDRYVLHPGGAKVLEALALSLDLDRKDLLSAWNVLQRVGNLSSATVLFVLQESLRRRPAQPKERGFLASFGAGFSCHGVLLQWG